MKTWRAANRFVTEHGGIASYHCFSAGPHYDPERIAFGPLVGVDEHHLDPGAGFDWHAHRGVTIVSWVLDGTLRHEDESRARPVAPGELFVQHTGDGIRHREWNASDSEALRFVQVTLLADDVPVRVETAACTVHGFAFVARGVWRAGGGRLAPGDAVIADEPVRADGAGELLTVSLQRRFARAIRRPHPPSRGPRR